MNVIVFGHNGVNATGLVRSLGRKNHNVYVILHESLVNFTAKSKYVKGVWYVGEKTEWLETIKSVCREIGGVILLLSTGDEEAKFINIHQEDLKDYCIVEGVSDKDIRHLYFKKDYIYKLAKDNGLHLIDTIIINSKQECLPNSIHYPVIVKALDSTCGGKDVMDVFNSSKELVEHINTIRPDYFPLQLQSFIKKEKEVMLQGCSLMHGQQIHIPICFVKTRCSGCGNGYGSFGYSISTSEDSELLDLTQKVTNILKKIGYQGLFSAEFLYAQGIYYFLEINFRNDGTSIVSTESGFNLPDIYCESFNNITDIKRNHFHKVYYMYEGDFSHVLQGNIGLLAWIKDALRRDCFWYMVDRNDWKPLISYFYFRIKRKIFNLLNK